MSSDKEMSLIGNASYVEMEDAEPALRYGKVEPPNPNKLGLFFGVYVQCVLSIIGIIWFLRFGSIVGEFGVLVSYAVYILSYVIVIMTVFSISAIATNGKIRGGGAYYMISRALGPEFGGSIGLIFYLANATNGSLYFSGFGQSLYSVINGTMPGGLVLPPFLEANDQYWFNFLVGSGGLAIMLIVCLTGAQFFTKAAFFILCIMIISILVTLGSMIFRPVELAFTDGNTFGSIFAVLFPSVTGLMAGANMSGDLAEPDKAIPKGTLMAMGSVSVLYFVTIGIIGATMSRHTIQTNFNFMQNIAVPPYLYSIGILCASLAGGLASLIGASRVMQALARDKLLPLGFLAQGSGPNDEPRRAGLITWILMELVLFIPSFNTIASFSSIFFLLSYFVTNLACFVLAVTNAPNFRPTWRYFGWPTALVGGLGCLSVMFIMSYYIALISLVILVCVIIYIHIWGPRVEWGNVWGALQYHIVRKYLLQLETGKGHIKYWRPQILLTVANPRSCENLIDFMNNLKKGGLFVLGHVELTSDYADAKEGLAAAASYHQRLTQYMESTKVIKGFAHVPFAHSFKEGIVNMLINVGLGGMRPNSVVFGFHAPNELPTEVSGVFTQAPLEIARFPPLREVPSNLSQEEYYNTLSEVFSMHRNVLVTRNFERLSKRLVVGQHVAGGDITDIDVWPCERDGISAETLTTVVLFAEVLKRTDIWKKYAKLRVLAIADNETQQPVVQAQLEAMMARFRIQAECIAVLLSDSERYNDAIRQDRQEAGVKGAGLRRLSLLENAAITNEIVKKNSINTSIVMFGMQSLPRSTNDYNDFHSYLDLQSQNLPPTVFINGVDVVFSDMA